jgi:hypothetical protein
MVGEVVRSPDDGMERLGVGKRAAGESRGGWQAVPGMSHRGREQRHSVFPGGQTGSKDAVTTKDLASWGGFGRGLYVT